ncbi:response regulator [Candidatus Viridilinea mediisalina]|uniref:response regulator n=1 Tax=Candidatus Viridilinea mediisalina TaxID=2024553 RepID=UPI0013FD167D|nr:response regulator [Candidatus Viridilinea mediisalina]
MATNILLIEDSYTQALRARLELERHGYTVRIATTGSSGIHMARAHLPDAVILDLELPHICGHDVCRLLKADQLTRSIPVIMLTSHTDEESRRRSNLVGAIAHIGKGAKAIDTIVGLLRNPTLLRPTSVGQSYVSAQGGL